MAPESRTQTGARSFDAQMPAHSKQCRAADNGIEIADEARPLAVMAATHHFESELQVGSQNIARALVDRGWDVIYLSAPVTILHIFSVLKPSVRVRVSLSLNGKKNYLNGRLHSYLPGSLIAPDGRFLLREKPVVDLWYRTCMPWTCPDFRHLGRPISLLYVDNLAYLGLCRELSARRKVFRVMDNHERFRGWNGRAREIARNIAQVCDLTVYSSSGLRDYVLSLNPKTAKCVPNAVDSEWLQEYPDEGLPEGFNCDGPFVLYVGAIDDRLDLKLLVNAARSAPDCRFVIAGPIMTGLPHGIPRNLEFIGAVGRSTACQLMRNAKAGLVPFDVASGAEKLTGIRPIKMLEYMAMGLPVICASWSDVESDELPIYRYKSERAFLHLVRASLKTQLDGTAGREYAESLSWQNVVDSFFAEFQN